MFPRHILAQVRHYSSTPKLRPLLLDLLPEKKMLNRLLFDFDARLNLNKYLPILESIYSTIGTDADPNLNKSKVKGSDLLTFQKILNEIRIQTHTSNRHLLDLEEELIERAAELGNSDALTILSYKALSDDSYSVEDKKQASIFIMKLSRLGHPLVFKMGGDYQFKEGNLNAAVKLYTQFLKLDPNSFLSSDVYKTLGQLAFQNKDLLKAKGYLEKSIKLAPLSKVSQSHFLLGLIHEADPLRARYHLEMAATQGFKESFANLGFLELNYFKNEYKAKEWFKLGAELGDANCMVGLFDCFIAQQDWQGASKTVERIGKSVELGGEGVDLNSVRSESIKLMIEKLNEINNEHEKGVVTQGRDKWSM